MRQKIDNNEGNLVAVGEEAAVGLDELALTLGIDPALAGTIRGLIATMLNARTSAQSGNETVRTRKAAVRAAMAGAKAFTILTREVLRPHLGGQYSQAWDITGFVGSLAIPTKASKMQIVLSALKTYLTDNPAREVAALNITAAQAELALNQLQTAVGALNLHQTDAGGFRKSRVDHRNVLRLTLQMLVATLNIKLDPMDDRWLSFGLNKPGAKETPPVPQGLEVALFGPNALSVKWPHTERADYHRVWKRVINVDADWVLVGTPADLDFLIEQLPSNSQVEVAIAAGNSGGESAKSESVIVQL